MATSRLDTFTKAYVEAALWSSTDSEGRPLDENYTVRDIAPGTLRTMVKDAEAFQAAARRGPGKHDIEGNLKRAGHDFWLTRNGHGAGFWDGGWPKIAGDRLTDLAHTFGEYPLYVGDDGKIHGMRG